MTALQEKKEEIVKILIKCPRVDVNVKNTSGDNLVLVALNNKKMEIVKEIIRCDRLEASAKMSLEEKARYLLPFLVDYYILLFISQDRRD